ncbi:hypothetical protein IQ07DRAFT_662567 [Pyrenochaeta sp. DS3sAY3a]|nr:hypothetical protein IQ07DRAFT_662567 [Pyrenochaeta sp. DS3sAY3a]
MALPNQPHLNFLPAQLQPNPNLLPAQFQPNPNLLPVQFQPNPSLLPAQFQPNLNFPPAHFQPNLNLLPPHPQIPIYPVPAPKTVYILSYSSDVLSKYPNPEAKLAALLPPGIPALLTVYCQTWRPPPAKMCKMYSGVSKPVQDFMRSSRTATREILYTDYMSLRHASERGNGGDTGWQTESNGRSRGG